MVAALFSIGIVPRIGIGQVDKMMNNKNDKRRVNIKSERGAAAVEFALVLPVFLLLVLGIITFGLIFKDYLGISHAAREGVRWAALGASQGEVDAKASAAAPQIAWGSASLQMIGVGSGGATESDQGNPVTIRVTYPLPAGVISVSNSLEAMGAIFGGVLDVPDTISAEATQRVE